MKVFERLKRIFSKESLMLEDGTLDFKQLLFKTVLASATFLLLIFFVIHLMHLKTFSNSVSIQKFINDFGMKGVVIFVYLVDLLILPLSPDMMWPFVLSWHPMTAILVMGVSSMAGAYSAYLMGRLIGLIPFIKNLTLRLAGDDSEKILRKYGIWAIVISGLTPLPFSTICCIAGILKLKPLPVFAACQIRFVRMAIYYLIYSSILG
ncbi:VTT domain-containing protein [uncultured Sphaerochaeta sp.]|uniref:YqaA family protein n=1 Tax=uncultured Sphaerochaeta sp. TaxID=886478 RepID=UPI002A0A3F8B|nr:VTT domain-containing protein [uncultured Sphaerochaeta sp.]